jgi:cell division control protein 45
MLSSCSFSIPQTQQPYPHMDMDLKKVLLTKLNDIAPEYGLVELSYPSFMRCYGYRSQPLSAADAVEGISALLDVAGDVRMEVEVEGARNGGEWFGGGKIWQVNPTRVVTSKRGDDSKEFAPTNEVPSNVNSDAAGVEYGANGTTRDRLEEKSESWWVKNFWAAFDALDE